MSDVVAKFIRFVEEGLEGKGLAFSEGKVGKGAFKTGGNWVLTKRAYLEAEEVNGKVKVTFTVNGRKGFIAEFYFDRERLKDNVEAFTVMLYALG